MSELQLYDLFHENKSEISVKTLHRKEKKEKYFILENYIKTCLKHRKLRYRVHSKLPICLGAKIGFHFLRFLEAVCCLIKNAIRCFYTVFFRSVSHYSAVLQLLLFPRCVRSSFSHKNSHKRKNNLHT